MSQVLRELPPIRHPDIVVGLDNPDDCGVVRVADDLAVVTTVDVFTPVVDDPYDYGRIAAINSLSDIFAMGARPVSALSIAGFPQSTLPLTVLTAIQTGLVDAAAACGVPVVGGHTVKNPEPLFGLAVTGVGHPDRLVLKGGAQPGDVLVLTKPLGIGVMTTGIKNNRLGADGIRRVTDLMLAPNQRAAEVMLAHGAHAATDVTGFGLLGHAAEMARGAGLTARLHWPAIPVLDEARPLAKADLFPGGARANLTAYAADIDLDPALMDWQTLLIADPQTSGGLLIAFPPERLEAALAAFAVADVAARPVGRLLDRQGVSIMLTAGDIDA
ncbi:MAG: selenide, water dikinase SelD [Thiohalocapsa sp.]|nr:selenide, water dikinase SelD [Thiohalocapsa sp.]